MKSALAIVSLGTKEEAQRFPAEWQAAVEHWQHALNATFLEPRERR